MAGGGGHAGGGLFSDRTMADGSRAIGEADDEGAASPSWDRANGAHSPLAALLRREFPHPAGKHSERRLFDDL